MASSAPLCHSLYTTKVYSFLSPYIIFLHHIFYNFVCKCQFSVRAAKYCTLISKVFYKQYCRNHYNAKTLHMKWWKEKKVKTETSFTFHSINNKHINTLWFRQQRKPGDLNEPAECYREWWLQCQLCACTRNIHGQWISTQDVGETDSLHMWHGYNKKEVHCIVTDNNKVLKLKKLDQDAMFRIGHIHAQIEKELLVCVSSFMITYSVRQTYYIWIESLTFLTVNNKLLHNTPAFQGVFLL